MRRIALDEVLPKLISPFDDQRTVGEIRALVPIRRVCVCLDQVVNRFEDETKRYGRLPSLSEIAYQDDLKEAKRLCRALELALQAGQHMIEAIEHQAPRPFTPTIEPGTTRPTEPESTRPPKRKG